MRKFWVSTLGIAALCLSTVAAAPSSSVLTKVDRRPPNNTVNLAARYQASQVADSLQARYANDPTFGAAWVTSHGVTVSLVHGGSTLLQTRLSIDARAVSIRTVPAQTSAKTLLELTGQIKRDASLLSQGCRGHLLGPRRRAGQSPSYAP